MTATEISEALARLGVLHQTTLPYSPYVNGKQETFWGQIEGRLMAMLEGVDDLTLAKLDEATQAWAAHCSSDCASMRSTTGCLGSLLKPYLRTSGCYAWPNPAPAALKSSTTKRV